MNLTSYPLVYLEEQEINEYELDEEGCYSYVRKGVREVVKARMVYIAEPYVDVQDCQDSERA